jgi:nicotinamide mononucleotide adenylyltransferase
MWQPAPELSIGCVTGRFQPFHVEHRELVAHVAERHDLTYVGIAGAVDGPVGPDHRAADNPFSYWQRAAMVHASLAEIGLGRDRYEVVPFPMHHPEQWSWFVPLAAVQYVRVRGDWEHGKAERLRAQYSVVTVPAPADAGVRGTEVRAALAVHDPRWRTWVGPSVAALIDEWGLS